MRPLIFPMILTMFCASCAGSPEPEGRAAAILDRAQKPAVDHAAALTGTDLATIRRTGLELITIVRCHVDCEGPK